VYLHKHEQKVSDFILYLLLLFHLFLFFYNPNLLSKKARHQKVFFKAEFMAGGTDRSGIHGRKGLITCHGNK